jgi:hypothetical protein
VAQESSPDAKGIQQLARSGSDLGKLHRIDFTLRFPTQLTAQRAELALIGFAFDTKIERGKAASEWIIHAVKVMYPVETDCATSSTPSPRKARAAMRGGRPVPCSPGLGVSASPQARACRWHQQLSQVVKKTSA